MQFAPQFHFSQFNRKDCEIHLVLFTNRSHVDHQRVHVRINDRQALQTGKKSLIVFTLKTIFSHSQNVLAFFGFLGSRKETVESSIGDEQERDNGEVSF